MRKVRNLFLHVLTGASIAIAILLVAVAYSDRVHPDTHPLLACAGMVFPFFLLANLLMLVVWVLVKWRRAWIPLAAFLLAYPAVRIYLPLHLSVDPPKEAIKVVSYNVAHFSFKNNCDNPLDSVFSYLRKQDADIVCLQEDGVHKEGTEPDYSSLYPYNDTVHVNKPTNSLINAVGIHSRFPVLRKELIYYDSSCNGSAAFFLLIDDDTVMVVNNHLESTHLNDSDRQHYTEMINGDMDRDDAKNETRLLLGKLEQAMMKRARQAEQLHEYIESHRQYPAIVLGDFNDTPISYVRRTVADGLTDCYVESGNGPGISFNIRGFYFRIDHLMCSRHFEPYNCYVDSHVGASDHYPVICWLARTQ